MKALKDATAAIAVGMANAKQFSRDYAGALNKAPEFPGREDEMRFVRAAIVGRFVDTQKQMTEQLLDVATAAKIAGKPELAASLFNTFMSIQSVVLPMFEQMLGVLNAHITDEKRPAHTPSDVLLHNLQRLADADGQGLGQQRLALITH